MANISFSDKPEETWVVAGWAFRQVLNDVTSQYPGDSEMVNVLADSRECKYLFVDSLDPALATRITRAITEVVKGILSGTIRSCILDQPWCLGSTLEEYRKGLQQLLAAIPDRPGTDSP